MNLLLLIFGGAVFFVFIFIFATTCQVGAIWWYILLAASFGLFSPKAVLVFLAFLSLFITMTGIARRRYTENSNIFTGNHGNQLIS